jgi:hypothetical protein
MTRSNDIDKWGRQHMRSSKSYLAGWKSKVWP